MGLRRPAIEYIRDIGCLFQLDLMALIEIYGMAAKIKTESWLSHNLFTVMTTGIRGIEDAIRLHKLMMFPSGALALNETIERHRTRMLVS